jgi:threonyl-tRNA synthetase
MPDRFDLNFVGEDGKEHRAFVVHRSSIGAIERIMAFLIEHYAGAFPLWLSPVQVRVLPIAEAHTTYAKEVFELLKKANIRAEFDDSNETLGKKIRDAKTAKIPYTLVIGDQEVDSRTATLEGRSGKLGQLSIDEIIIKLADEIERRV